MPKSVLEQLFPNLRREGYSIESECTEAYNCVAWAVGHSTGWWWLEHRGHWPVQPKAPVLEAFVRLFQSLGYEPCVDQIPEPEYEKVAIYVSVRGFVTHVARQLPSGLWTSKCGEMEDIIHTLEGLEGPSPAYGTVEQILRRPLQATDAATASSSE